MIKMPSLPFDSHKEFLPYFDGGKIIDTYIPKEIFDSNYLYVNPVIPFLRKIEYVEKPQVQFFTSLQSNIDSTFDFTANPTKIGLYKALDWNFQSEWRYSMFLVPHYKDGRIKIDVSDKIDGLYQSYYDVRISENAFKTMEIITGPKISDGEKVLVETICEKFLPGVKLNSSKLKIR